MSSRPRNQNVTAPRPSRGRRSNNRPLHITYVQNQRRPFRARSRPQRFGISRVKPKQQKKKVVKRQLDKVKVILSGEQRTVVTANTKTSVPADTVSFWALCESLIADLFTISDIAESTDPCLYEYYFYNLYLMHIKRFGGLTGDFADLVNTNSADSTLAVPFSLAKFLEYLGPYKKGVQLQTSFDFSTDLTPDSNTNVGFNGNIAGITRTGLTDWAFYSQGKAAGSSANSTGLLYSQTPWTAGTPPTGTPAFSAFLLNVNLIAQLSGIIEGAIKCIPLKDVPDCAPDASAYGSASSQINLGVLPKTIHNLVSDFDPEVTICMSLGRVPGFLSNLRQKSFPQPRETLLNVPYYMQLFATWIYLGRIQEKTYRKGKLKSTLTFHGQRLVTLYRTRQYIDGIGLSKMVDSYYKLLMNSKSFAAVVTSNVASVPDVTLQNFTYLMGVCFMAAQFQMNLHCVDHVFTPWIDLGDAPAVPYLLPQACYLEYNWGSVELCPLIAAMVSGIAPVVIDGCLRTPASDYQSLSFVYNTSTQQIPGPITWSYWGYNQSPDSYYTIPNLMSTCFGNANTTSAANQTDWAPNVRLTYRSDNSGTTPTAVVPTVLDTVWASNYTSAQTGIPDVFNFFGWTLNGNLGVVFIKYYNQWFARNFTASQPPLMPPESTGVGSPEIMTTQVATNQSGDINPITPLYVDDSVGVAPSTVMIPPNGTPSALDMTPDNLVSATPLTDNQSLAATLFNASEVNTQANGTTLQRQFRLTLKSYLFADPASLNPVEPTNYGGNSTVDPPAGAQVSSLLQSVMRKFTDPNAAFSKELSAFIEKRPTHLPKGEEMPTTTDLVMKHLKPFAAQFFKQQVRPTINKYNFMGEELVGPLADKVSYLENTQGVTTTTIDNQVSKKKFLGKLIGKAKSAAGKVKGALNVAKDIKKGVEAATALFE